MPITLGPLQPEDLLDEDGNPLKTLTPNGPGGIAPSRPKPPPGSNIFDPYFGLDIPPPTLPTELPTQDFEDDSSGGDGSPDGGGSEYGADTVLPEISAPDNPPKDDEPTEEDTTGQEEADTTLKDASIALNVLSKVTDLVKNLFKVKADIDLQDGMNKAQKNLSEGQNKMVNSGENVNKFLNGLSDSNSKVTDFGNQLSQIQFTLSSQISSIASMTGNLSMLNSQLANQTVALNQAQSRLDQAIARTDLSLPEKRVEIRSANYDLMQKSFAVNDTTFNLANVTDTLNSAGSQYNQTLSQASATRESLATAYGQSRTFENALNKSVGEYNQGAQQYSQGVSGMKDTVGNYKNTINQLAVVAEASAGASGISKILNSIDNGKYAQATGDALLSGVDAIVRNGGPFELSMARGLIGAGINSASQAVDMAFANGDWSKIASNFTKDFGQATLRTNDMIKVGQGIDLAFTIALNTSNPNRWYDAGQIGLEQIGPISQISTQVIQTVSVLIPGAQGVSPAIEIILPALGVGAQGMAQTVLDTGKKIFDGEFSAQVSESSQRLVAGGTPRGLVTYASGSGGATSAPSVLIFGSGVSIGEMAKQAVVGSLTNQNFAMEASATVNAIAKTGLPSAGVTTQISAGSFTFKADSKDIVPRPPSADPVIGSGVAY